LLGTKALAYYEKSYLTAVKSFVTLAPGYDNLVALTATRIDAEDDLKDLKEEDRKCRDLFNKHFTLVIYNCSEIR